MDETALLEAILSNVRTAARGVIILVGLVAGVLLLFACRKA